MQPCAITGTSATMTELGTRGLDRASRLHSAHFVTFFAQRQPQTKHLQPPEVGAAFSFCNILVFSGSCSAEEYPIMNPASSLPTE
jgi:hypothetical protein